MYKLRFLFLLVAFSFIINAQELDEDFLDSLPDEVRDDILQKAGANEKGSEENFRPSIYSSKLEKTEQLLELKNRIELDLLELERRLKSDEELSISEDLILFGSDFFRTFQTSYMPIN